MSSVVLPTFKKPPVLASFVAPIPLSKFLQQSVNILIRTMAMINFMAFSTPLDSLACTFR